MRCRALCARVLAVGVMAPPLHAQVRSGPPGYHNITPAAAAESLAVIRHLTSVVRANPDSGAAWYRRGMVAWALAARDNVNPPIKSLDWTVLGHMADTSLRRAAQAPPYRVDYKLAVGRYLASSFGVFNRVAARAQYTGALKQLGRLAANSSLATASVEAGRLYFRFYDQKEGYSLANDAPETQAYIRQTPGLPPPPTVLEVSALLNRTLNARDFPGEYFYLRAEALFADAARTDPAYDEAFHGNAMVFAARNRWSELAALGRIRVQRAPADPWGWMALGLAAHRTRQPHVAAGAFDSALVRFDAATRTRLDHFERVLRPADSVAYASRSPQARANAERLFWITADPLWSVPGNEPRLEFLARLAYAEFRFSNKELNAVGTETDRGRTFIRYGPPASIASDDQSSPGRLLSNWLYDRFGAITFVGFDQLRWLDEEHISALARTTPARWDNIPSARIDSLPVQVARFRAGHDSVDVILAHQAPVAALAAASPVVSPPRAHVWFLRSGLQPLAQATRVADPDGRAAFRTRLPPGSYLYRTEASADGSDFGARASNVLVADHDSATGFDLRGFGISDVLLAERIDARTQTPTRWHDFDGRILAGPIDAGNELSLIWETYELASDSANAARYGVTITIERERAQAGRIAAGIVRGIAGAVGVEQAPDRVEMSFERSVAHAPVVVDHIALSLRDTPAGRYALSVRIQDKVSGRTASWSRPLIIE